MPRRSRLPEIILALLVLFAAPVRADVSGAVDGRALIGFDQRYGAGLMADVWGLRGAWRPGGFFGLGGLSENSHASSRLMSPLGFSLAFVPWPDRSSLFVIARAGGYMGSEKGGFIAGGFAGGALGYGLSIGEGVTVRFAADAWGLIGTRGGVFIGPAVGLGF